MSEAQPAAAPRAAARRAALLDAVRPRVVAWRRHFHAHPERSFEEHATARTIAATLGELGLEPIHPTPTSVVAEVAGALPGRTVALRADVDALPVEEDTGLPYASREPGVMHACGHDGHAAVLLGVAAVLAELRDRLPGRVRLIFQHGEERPPQGAPELIAAGVLDGVAAILGQHLWAPLPLGVVGLASGPAMGSADLFEVRLSGRGGHAALPHDARDPVPAAVDLVQALQRLVAREVDPLVAAVVSTTRLHAGAAFNVIPGEAVLGGTIRTLDAGVRAHVRARVQELARDVARAHRLDARTSFQSGPPPLVNEPGAVATLARAASACDAVEEVRELPPTLAADDFACYLEHVPGAYAFVGAGLPGTGGPFPHHHPRFTIEEDALAIATELLTGAALELAAPLA